MTSTTDSCPEYHAMSYREKAIQALDAMGQKVYAEGVNSGNLAYYVERDGEISADQYIGSSYERQSVYFNAAGAAIRLGDVGLGSCGYNGSEADICELVAIAADQSAKLRLGKFYGDYIHPSDLPDTVAAEHGLYWDGNTWCVTGELLDWHHVQDDHPCQDWTNTVRAIPYGWFEDEGNSQNV